MSTQPVSAEPQDTGKSHSEPSADVPKEPNDSDSPAPKKAGPMGFILGGVEGVKDLWRGLRSSDSPTRSASYFFWILLAGVLVLSSILIRNHLKERSERAAQIAKLDPEVRRLEDLARKQAEDQKRITTTIPLGAFEIDLKLEAGEKAAPGTLHVAQIEIVVECDSKETKQYLGEAMIQARSQIFDALLYVTKNELLSREGKRRIRRAIMIKLNSWLPHGKVEDLFFTRVVVT